MNKIQCMQERYFFGIGNKCEKHIIQELIMIIVMHYVKELCFLRINTKLSAYWNYWTHKIDRKFSTYASNYVVYKYVYVQMWLNISFSRIGLFVESNLWKEGIEPSTFTNGPGNALPAELFSTVYIP